MYEKHGLMVKITNPEVIAYLRNNPDTPNKQLIEAALREKIGIPPKVYQPHHGRKKVPDCINVFPVKIKDRDLVEYILFQREKFGILQKHTVESAVLQKMEREKNERR